MVQTADRAYPQIGSEVREPGAHAPSVEDMTAQIAELERRSRQHGEDIVAIYEMMRDLELTLGRRFTAVESRLDSVESRLDAVESRLGAVEELLREVVGLLQSSRG